MNARAHSYSGKRINLRGKPLKSRLESERKKY